MIWVERCVLTEIRAHGQQAFPQEACGLVLQREGVQELVRMRNLAAADDQFQIEPEDMLPYLLQSELIVCFYHSHPTQAAIPSDHDVTGYTYSFPHLIYSVRDDEMRAYEVQDGTWREAWKRKPDMIV